MVSLSTLCGFALVVLQYSSTNAERVMALDMGKMSRNLTTVTVEEHEHPHSLKPLLETHEIEPRSHLQNVTWHDSFLQQAEGLHATLGELTEIPSKSRAKEALVMFEVLGLGALGVDRMYMGGRWGVLLGMAKLLSCGGCGIWALADFVVVLSNALREEDKIDVLGIEGEFDRAGLQSARWIAMGAIVFISFFVCIRVRLGLNSQHISFQNSLLGLIGRWKSSKDEMNVAPDLQ